jgi:hypothetical protein
MQNARQGFLHSVTLLASMSTLVCCALPVLFVAVGAGAVLAGVVAAVPQLIWLTEHKIFLFAFAGLMLALSGLMRYHSRNAPCPADPEKAHACMRLRKAGGIIWMVSVLIYVTGFFFAFIAPLWLV